MRRLPLLAFLSTTALVAAACAPLAVSSHIDRGLDFTQYRTYQWGPADSLPTGDARLDKNPDFQDHMQGAVEKELAARGFEARSESADLMIHFHANVSERVDIDRVDRERGYCPSGNCSPNVFNYEAGTIVLDMVDGRTNRLVWRGWAQGRLEAFLDNPDAMARRINEAVGEMFKRFPRPL
jgi:hypothetical protein